MAGPAPEWVVRALSGVVHSNSRDKGTSIVELGLLRSVTVCEGHARVELRVVSGWCPFVTRVLADVQDTLCAEPGVDSCHVELVFDGSPDDRGGRALSAPERAPVAPHARDDQCAGRRSADGSPVAASPRAASTWG